MTSRHPNGPVALRGQRVCLREFRADDLDGVRGIVGDDRVTYFLPFNSRGTEQARAMLRGIMERARRHPRTEYYLAITPLGTESTGGARNTVVGFARLARSGTHAAKLGYAVAYDHQGHGYATDAARTLLDFAFGALRLHRVTAAVGPDNRAGLASVEHLGSRLHPRGRAA